MDSVHAKILTRFTPDNILVFRVLLETTDPHRKADLVYAKMRTRSTLRWGLGLRKNVDSVHSGTHPRFKALLEIEIKIEHRNTSSDLGLYSRSRSRSNSGTHSRFYGSTQDWDWDWDRDWTPEHILVFRALLGIKIKIKIKLRNTSSFLGLYWRSQVSHVTHFFFFFSFRKCGSKFVEGFLSMGPTPSCF